IVAPEAKRAHQTLAFPRGALLCTGKTNRDVGMECLLARLIELVHCAGLAEALGEFRHRFGSLVGLGEEANDLLRRDCAIEGTARFGRRATSRGQLPAVPDENVRLRIRCAPEA